MSKFMVNLTAINLVDKQRRTAPIKVMVDTGAELSWLPRKVLEDAGIAPEYKGRFILPFKKRFQLVVAHPRKP